MPSGVYYHKPLSESTKIKIGIGNTGKKHPELAERNKTESAREISRLTAKMRIGKYHHSELAKAKMILSRTGLKRSEETIQKMRLAAKRRIANGTHPWWKGGITPMVDKIRSSIKYKFWRTAVFQRDDYTCVWCKQRGGKLNADHIIPFSKIMEKLRFEQGVDNVFEKAMNYDLLWDLNNGRTLCIDCHKKTDTYLRGSLK